ncbi:MAG TPA: serine hydrolase [Bacteroidia bacterium]|nr:serine hydrolase [Bacteroidia bacterium]
MKKLKSILKWTVIVLVMLNALIFISGRTYLYKGIANTYLKGRKGPDITEYKIFANREVKTGTPQPWAVSADYNKKNIPEKDLVFMKKYKTIAYLIVKNDSICYEQYWDGFGKNSITNSFSMAKTFVSILTGIAIDEGKIKSVDEPIGDFLPQFKTGENAKVTIKDLLTMSSGINFDENYVSPFAYPAEAYYGTDLQKLTYGYKVTEQPGKVFKYLSGDISLLSFVIEKATGMKLSDYASEKLWQPMGAENPAYWSLDHKGGVEKAYCCFNSDARDFARFGELYLQNGNWNGKQLVSEAYVKASITPADLLDQDGNKNEKYGYNWWLLNYKGHPVFYARGILGQYIFVIPDEKMVVVRLGKTRAKEETNGHPNDVYELLDAALSMYGGN